MKLRIAQAALLLAILPCGCVHKQKPQNQPPLAPPIEDTPPSKPDKAPVNLPPPVVTIPEEKKPTVTEAPPPPPPPKPAPKHRRKQSENNNQIAENTPPPEVSAAGQLSTGDPSDQRQQTSNSIADTEHRLNTLGRTLDAQEQKTSAQIREFIKEARAALNTGDVDGAKTLAQKAKVLLGELTK
jgi:hypothetical protein